MTLFTRPQKRDHKLFHIKRFSPVVCHNQSTLWVQFSSVHIQSYQSFQRAQLIRRENGVQIVAQEARERESGEVEEGGVEINVHKYYGRSMNDGTFK